MIPMLKLVEKRILISVQRLECIDNQSMESIRLGMTQEELAKTTFIPKPTISNYENDRIDIKSSVIAEPAKVLKTDPNYLIMGEKASESDNRFVNEAVELFSKITDSKMQEMLLKQIRALV